jgi:hypothetical protein
MIGLGMVALAAGENGGNKDASRKQNGKPAKHDALKDWP